MDWIESYLEDRNQHVKYNDYKSADVPVLDGVPQGSVLGLLLFSAYITPVSEIIDKFKVCHHMYADDLTLYLSLGKDKDNALQNIASCTQSVAAWFLMHDMLLNETKSE